MRQNAVIASITDCVATGTVYIEHMFSKVFFSVMKRERSNKRKPNENQGIFSTSLQKPQWKCV